MSKELAEQQADSIAQTIYADIETGDTFGRNEDDHHKLDAYEWLEDALDIEYRVSGDGNYRSAKVLTGWGGPNVWIDTAREQVGVAWYCEPVYRDLPETFCRELDEALEELWSAR